MSSLATGRECRLARSVARCRASASVASVSFSQYYRPVPLLDDWIRRRARMCYWKQWRWRRKRRSLLCSTEGALRIAQGTAGPETQQLAAKLEKVTGCSIAELAAFAEDWPA